MQEISNGVLTVLIDEMGAELQSIKDAGGKEYMWDGDADYWPRKSPILFPIVCSVWNNTYRVDGKEYQLPRHGFARQTRFEVIDKSDNAIMMAIEDTEETLTLYPFRFRLAVTYVLEDNMLSVTWQVYNNDKREIYFQVGGHPAFMVPGAEKGQPLKGMIRVDADSLQRLHCTNAGCMPREYETIPTPDGLLPLSDSLFADDALILDKQQVKHIEILDEEGKPQVTVDCLSPALGIWSPAGKHAPFVCIEPWFGIPDWAEFTGDMRDKYLVNCLQPGATFSGGYVVTIGE